MLESCSHRQMCSDMGPLDLVERDRLVEAIVELRGAGGLVPRNPSRDLEVTVRRYSVIPVPRML